MPENTKLTIAHLSDLHFSKFIPSFSQFFSKRWIGNTNLLFSRGRVYLPEILFELPEFFKTQGVQYVTITGDLSTTSLPQEFLLAKELVEAFKLSGIEVLTIPGNHDQYTRNSYIRKEFYQHFPNDCLEKNKICVKQLQGNWWAILLDCAIATNWISSKGLFAKELDDKLREALFQVPENGSVIIMNHYPLFQNDSTRKELKRAEHLQGIIQQAFPKVKLYLNGHTHRHCIADLRANHYPILLDSGSCSHKRIGSWNLIQIEGSTCSIQPYGRQQGQWIKLSTNQTFNL